MLLADRGYDADWFRQTLAARGTTACIPSRKGSKAPIPHDAVLYRRRHKIENMFGRLKDSVGVAPQYASSLGKNTNCQTLVSVTLASREVLLMVGMRLFLPDSWTSDLARMVRAKVPMDRQVA